ncbi:TetR family transcriptional regulator [Nonomuraea sp. NPDC050536]|uniref:TetR family transcriptional regulator n=1 Tax=Nonomuraea sp. NPDC050536 TaxID=3364366 RepID=UPI0037CB8551
MTTQRKISASAARRTSRRAIITAAFDLVQEVGYAKLSIEGIAARAAVGKLQFYWAGLAGLANRVRLRALLFLFLIVASFAIANGGRRVGALAD